MKIKLPDLRKYFFANIMAFLGFCLIIYIICFFTANFPPPEPLANCTEPSCYSISKKELYYMACFFIIFNLNLAATFLLLLEILIRWVIKKMGPNCKMPKTIKNIYTLIFIVGLIVSLCFTAFSLSAFFITT